MFCAYRPTDMTKRITKPPCRQQRDRPPSIISNFSFFKQDRIINSHHHNTVSIYCTCFPTGNTPTNHLIEMMMQHVLWFCLPGFRVKISCLSAVFCDCYATCDLCEEIALSPLICGFALISHTVPAECG